MFQSEIKIFSPYFWDCFVVMLTFCFSKLTGILPTHVGRKWFTSKGVLQEAGEFEGTSTLSLFSNICGWLFMILNSALLAIWYNSTGELSRNELLVYYPMTNSVPAYLLIVLACLVRRQATVRCLHSAATKYCMSPPHIISCSFILVSLFVHFSVIAIVCSLYYQLCNDLLSRLCFLVLVELSYLPSFSASLLISCLCLVAERAYSVVNDQLEHMRLSLSLGKLKNQIDILMFQHEVITDFVEEINSCFSYDLVALLIDFTYQLIFFSYSVTFFNRDNNQFFVIRILIVAVRLVKFFVICNSSQQLEKQVKLLSINLHNVKMQLLDHTDPEIEQLLSDFSGAVDARPVILSAAGFTKIDFTLLFKLTGTAVMYACAAYQYNTTTKTKA